MDRACRQPLQRRQCRLLVGIAREMQRLLQPWQRDAHGA
jgi:hypothetical protein